MNGISSPRSGLVFGYRSLAHVITGLESFAVVALLWGIVLGNDLPAWDSLLDVVIAAIVFVAAYPVGLIVDGVATKVWRLLARSLKKPTRPRTWLVRRTNPPGWGKEVPETATDFDRDKRWLVAQSWLWSSEGARAEFGDLRFRMMLGKNSALNAFLGLLVCALGLFIMSPGGRGITYTAVGVPHPSFAAIQTLSVMTGTSLFLALWLVLISPRKQLERSWEPREWRFWARWIGGLGALGVTVFFIIRFPELASTLGTEPDTILSPFFSSSYLWVAVGTALGPWLVFAFMYVRVDANRLYLGLVQDAERIGSP